MSQVLVELDIPKDWRHFKLPPALHTRLQGLLDRQDRDGKLTRAERQEAQALTELCLVPGESRRRFMMTLT